jgi:hypothetical protein
MASSVQLSISSQIKTNITSSLAMSPNYQHFVTLTRQLSTTSSQWVYRLDYYDATFFQKLETIDIYNTYNVDKHFLAFVPSPNKQALIAVATINNLIFYRTGPLTQLKSLLHRQANVYDLTASPNGELVVLVGQTIMAYRTIGFKEIIFPQIVENARHCAFSSSGNYMVIASTSSINLYTFQRSNDDYTFQQVPLTVFQAPVEYGAITSVQFNPRNFSELVIGYLSSSPGSYSIENGGLFFKKFQDIQPMSSQNAKIASYMPDTQRYYSYDYNNGVGLWPGPGGKLYYLENFLLYDAHSNALGTRLVGYVWENIKVADIMLNCTGGTMAATCPCPNGQAWNYASYQCQALSCQQAEYSTGVPQGNRCQCNSTFSWDPVVMKCAVDCASLEKTLPGQPGLYECYCGDNFSWNPQTRSCVFDCTQVPYSSGELISNSQCRCLQGFQWNPSLLQCECPSYMVPAGSTCLCITSYTLVNNICVPDCTQIPNANGTSPTNPQECACLGGHYFTVRSDQAGCQLNCSAIADTTQEYDFNTCLCMEHMDWLNSTCVVDCKKIDYADSVAINSTTCACAINYHWRSQIKECARNCSGVAYTVPNGAATLRSCPCIESFLWSETNTRCEIQCGMIANSQQWSLS